MPWNNPRTGRFLPHPTPSSKHLGFAALHLAFACAAATPPVQVKGPQPVDAGDRAVAKLADRYLDQRLKLDPARATEVGYRKWDPLLPDESPQGIARALAMLRGFAAEVKRIDAAKLSPPFAADLELIRHDIDGAIFEYAELKPFEWDVQRYNRTIGAAFYDLCIPPESAADWPKRLEAILQRMNALPKLVEDAKRNLKAPPRVFTELVMKTNPGNIEMLDKQVAELFAAYPPLKARFEKQKPAAMKALKDFQALLEGELLLRSTGSWRLGRAKWEKKLELTLASSMKAEDIYREAEKGLETTRFEMYDVAFPLFRRMFASDDRYLSLYGDERISYVVGKVIEEASRDHGTADGLFDDVQKTAARVKGFLEKSALIGLPPASDNFVIERTPAYLDGVAVAFFHPAPAFEPELKKAFWISSVPKAGTADGESFLREYNHHMLDALTIHEALPGHYVQSYWSEHSPFTSITKNVLSSGTMTEGWAVLIEQIVHKEGFSASDPKSKLFSLKMLLRSYINAMLDAKLHTSSEDEKDLDHWALELMMKKGFQEEAEAVRKLRRAKITSTQLSTYFVGYKEMRGIYEAAKKKAGASFTNRSVLEKMISYGSIEPRMIKRLMEADGAL
jgi:uncharacterized protein (DUF885 family)